MRKAILVVLSILAVSLLMVSCAPQPAGKAAEAELEQLSDAELEQAIAEGEAAESKALAGQAYSAVLVKRLPSAYKVAYKRVKAAQPTVCPTSWECDSEGRYTYCGTCPKNWNCEPTWHTCKPLT